MRSKAASDGWQHLGAIVLLDWDKEENSNPMMQVLPLSVEPGFGGQKVQPAMMQKVRDLRHKYPALQIEVGDKPR